MQDNDIKTLIEQWADSAQETSDLLEDLAAATRNQETARALVALAEEAHSRFVNLIYLHMTPVTSTTEAKLQTSFYDWPTASRRILSTAADLTNGHQRGRVSRALKHLPPRLSQLDK